MSRVQQDREARTVRYGVVGEDVGEDAALIVRSCHEPDVFAVLFERYAPEIKRYVTRRVGSEAAEDVTAETFLVAFRQRDRYDRTCPSARPWLYGIATNLVGRHRRTELTQLRLLARSGSDRVIEGFTDRSDARVSADAVSRRLAAALARLPSPHRSVLLLIAWADLTYAETASALGVPVGTVRSRVNRARSKIRRVFGDLDPTAVVEGDL